MPDEMDELLKQLDYLEGRIKVPSDDPYKEEVKETLSEKTDEKDLDSILKEFNEDLEGMLDSIGSYRKTLTKARTNI
jgi:DNA-binding transcriptional regulator GbsR (MarR family)